MTRILTSIVFLAALATVPQFAAAQKGAVPPEVEKGSPQLDSKACADRDRMTLGDTHETTGQGGPPKDDLSDRLARTDGVICPPRDVDPDIHSAPPGGGRTPVIPPPGSPGGDPSVQPK